jgi:hypothetical protein
MNIELTPMEEFWFSIKPLVLPAIAVLSVALLAVIAFQLRRRRK